MSYYYHGAAVMSSNLNTFQIRTLRIMAQLLEKDAIDDAIIEELWRNELEYFSLLEMNRILGEKINIDQKTGLLRHNHNYLSDIVKTASRLMSNLNQAVFDVSFVRFDIDDFSRFNNRYGHDLGDEVLVSICSLIKNNSRPTDYVIRFGGEEIDVLLPSTPVEGAIVYTEKILKETSDLAFCHESESSICTTLSAGISTTKIRVSGAISSSDIDNEYRLLQKQSDDALYESKLMGKNRLSIYSSERREEYPEIRRRYCRV